MFSCEELCVYSNSGYSAVQRVRSKLAQAEHKALYCESIISRNEQFKMLACVWPPPILSSIRADQPQVHQTDVTEKINKLSLHLLTFDFRLTSLTQINIFRLNLLCFPNWYSFWQGFIALPIIIGHANASACIIKRFVCLYTCCGSSCVYIQRVEDSLAL